MQVSKLVAISCAGIVFLSCAWTASATNFSLAGDWSSTTNPNGPWSYNQGSTPLPSASNWEGLGQGWAPSNNTPGDFLPGMVQATAAALPVFGTDPNNGLDNVLAGDIITHTVDGHNGNPSLGVANFLFTLPAGDQGNYQISGSVWDAALDATRPQDWTLLVNGAVAGSGRMSGDVSRSEAQTFDISEFLVAGETVDLELYMDPNGDGNGFFVGSNMVINSIASPIPEPSPLLLIFSGLAAVLGAKEARRRGYFDRRAAAGCPTSRF